MNKNIQLVAKVYGFADAETIRIFLEAAGIEVMVAQESAGKSLYPVSIGRMAQAKIYVRSDQAEEAKALLHDMDSGYFLDMPDLNLSNEDTEI